MAPRMLCTDCLHVGTPDTVLDGSDRLELLAWACFVVPGLLYCWWRHLGRRKICPLCGSGALMRESRASAARRPPQAEPFAGARVLADPVSALHWPRALVSPRGRLRSGSVAALTSAFALCAMLLGSLELTPTSQARMASALGWGLCAAWIAWQFHQLSRARGRLGDCEAWDESGRRLRIEAW